MAEPTEEISIASTSEQFQLGIRLESIFMPHARKQREAIYMGSSGLKPSAGFVHYTSAEAALKIIKSKRVWMRNTTCMADYSEVQHGYQILHKFFVNEARKRQFYEALDAVSPNIAAEALGLFDQWWNNIHVKRQLVDDLRDSADDIHRPRKLRRTNDQSVEDPRQICISGIPIRL